MKEMVNHGRPSATCCVGAKYDVIYILGLDGILAFFCSSSCNKSPKENMSHTYGGCFVQFRYLAFSSFRLA